MAASSRSAVPTSSWRSDAAMMRAGILRVGAERHHVGGHAPHRPHQQVVQREIDQRRGDRGNDQRQQQDADGESTIALRSGASSSTISTNSPPIGAGPTTRITSLSAQNSVSNASMMARCHDMSRMSMSWLIAGGISRGREQPALLAHLQRDGAGADAVQDLARDRVRHHAVRRRLEHQRRGVGGGRAGR